MRRVWGVGVVAALATMLVVSEARSDGPIMPEVEGEVMSALAGGTARTTVVVHYEIDRRALRGMSMSERVAAIRTVRDAYLDQLPEGSATVVFAGRAIPVLILDVSEPGFSTAMGLDDTRAIQRPGTVEQLLLQSVPLINADTASAAPETSGGDGATVCVVDSGIDYQHPDLGNGALPNSVVIGGAAFVNRCTISNAFCDPTIAPCGVGEGTCVSLQEGDPIDENGHGTLVAGTVHAVAPDAKLVAAKAAFPGGEGVASEITVVAAMDWCLAEKDNFSPPISVMNLSLGRAKSEDAAICDDPMTALGLMGSAANSVADAGITVVAASGNSGNSDGVFSPSCASSVISVGATFDADVGPNNAGGCNEPSTFADLDACWGTTGKLLDVYAPGIPITGPDEGGGTQTTQGTSFSAPHVSGVAALLETASPDVNPLEVRNRIRGSNVLVTDRKVPTRSFPRVDAEQTVFDADGDGVCDGAAARTGVCGVGPDNCPFFDNASQTDTNSNGIGDACECGDQGGVGGSGPGFQDGVVNLSDIFAINDAILNPALVTDLCDTNCDEACNLLDIFGVNDKILNSFATCIRYPFAPAGTTPVSNTGTACQFPRVN